jgi:hypothetical protein
VALVQQQLWEEAQPEVQVREALLQEQMATEVLLLEDQEARLQVGQVVRHQGVLGASQ